MRLSPERPRRTGASASLQRRARDLLVVAIPKKTGDDVIKALQGFGLTEWGQANIAAVPALSEFANIVQTVALEK